MLHLTRTFVSITFYTESCRLLWGLKHENIPTNSINPDDQAHIQCLQVVNIVITKNKDQSQFLQPYGTIFIKMHYIKILHKTAFCQ